MNVFDMAIRMADNIADALDYSLAAQFSKLTNTPTRYKGRGRPRKSDYGRWQHPFDGKIILSINRHL